VIPETKVEQHLLKLYRLTSSQASHFFDEAVKNGQLKREDGNIHLPSWIKGGLQA